MLKSKLAQDDCLVKLGRVHKMKANKVKLHQNRKVQLISTSGHFQVCPRCGYIIVG